MATLPVSPRAKVRPIPHHCPRGVLFLCMIQYACYVDVSWERMSLIKCCLTTGYTFRNTSLKVSINEESHYNLSEVEGSTLILNGKLEWDNRYVCENIELNWLNFLSSQVNLTSSCSYLIWVLRQKMSPENCIRLYYVRVTLDNSPGKV